VIDLFKLKLYINIQAILTFYATFIVVLNLLDSVRLFTTDTKYWYLLSMRLEVTCSLF